MADTQETRVAKLRDCTLSCRVVGLILAFIVVLCDCCLSFVLWCYFNCCLVVGVFIFLLFLMSCC